MSKSDDLSRQQSKLSPAKRALLDQWMKGGHAAETRIIPRRSEDDTAPLSFAQQRLWFLEQFEPGTATYHLSSALRLTGSLSIAALRRAFNEVLRRHEVLRACFPSSGGLPIQRINPHDQAALSVYDLSELGERWREAEAKRLTSQEAVRLFDLARGPLFRAALLRLSPRRHLLLLTMHHIVSDGWSMGVLVGELTTLYSAFARGAPSPLAELPIQYADYARWQRRYLRGEVLERQLSYWRAQLAGAPPLLELPADRARPAARSFRGASCRVEFDAGLTRRLRELSHGEGATLHMTLLAGFQLLLSRYAGQREVVVGTPVAGRTRAEVEGLVGMFVNTVALRTELGEGLTFRGLVARVRGVCLGAYAHQEVAFERVVEELRPGREGGRTPLFQVMFNLLNFTGERIELAGLTVEAISKDEVWSKLDLTLYSRERADRIRLDLVYNADLFARARMFEMTEQLKSLFAQIVENPDKKIDRYSLVTSNSEALLPCPTRPLFSRWEGSLCRRFSEQAGKAAERPALADKDGTWTYGELDSISNQLANYLRAGGVKLRECVAVYGHRSASLVCALLGILKAGAAFIILDPAYPPSRLIEVLRVAKPLGWIELEAAGEVPSPLQEFVAALPVCRVELPRSVATVRKLFEDCAASEPAEAVGADDLAYVAFTSGSTGKPKGIAGTHRPLSHFFQWHTQTFGLQESDRFSMLSGLSHDPLLRDIFTPLWLGAKLCIPDPEYIASPGWLAQWMMREEISVAHLTPAMGQLLSGGTRGENATGDQSCILESLRHVFWGGDLLTQWDVNTLHSLAPSAVSVNFYGATETPQAMGYFIVPGPAGTERDEARTTSRAGIPLGKGIEGVQLLILNGSQQLAGVSELGEIYVRTPYLTRGYLDDDALTRQRFIINPFTETPGDLLYKTGDLGRYLPDGGIEFLGREDQQVKVRGFRIELGEIEAALCELPGVREAVALLSEDHPGGPRLVAYVVPAARGPGARGPGEWRAELKRRLPEYMVPAAMVALDELPLTPNGKVDRRALARVEAGGAGAGVEYVAPRTPIEGVVAGVWCEVLRVERVGVGENFFALGGHSLLATQVVARLQDAFPVKLSLREFFDNPDVASLAKRIETAMEGEQVQWRMPPIKRAPREGRLSLSFAQQRLWFLNQLEPESAAYNISAGVRVRGLLNHSILDKTINTIVERHEVLRTIFKQVDGEPAQVISAKQVLNLPVVDLQELPRSEVKAALLHLADEEAGTPFDLTRGPLLRVVLLRVNEQEYVVLLTAHHIISDGWSMGVLIGEVASLYEAFTAGKPSPLPALPIQYADYAHWQREWLRDETLEAHLSYWREKLKGQPPVLSLPADHPRPAAQTFRGARLSQHLPRTLAEGLKELCGRYRVTKFMALLAAFKTLLYRYTQQPDIVVGTPIANRGGRQLEPLIGFFANTLVLRTDLSGDPDFQQLLERVRETALGAYAHQDVPFERLVGELQVARDLSHTPLFQVMFTLQNAPAPERKSSNLTLSFIEAGGGTAKFDLELLIAEREGGLAVTWEYNTDLFERGTIAMMAGHFQNLLMGAVMNPQQPISSLPLLTSAERQRLLAEWNDTRADVDFDKCAHQLFEEQAERTPDALAVVCADERLTYAELNVRANRLAEVLVERGVGPDVLVAILSARDTDLLTAILAVFKAGGAYLPLDPLHPAARLEQVLRQSRSHLLLTTEEFTPVLSTALDGLQERAPEVLLIKDLLRQEGRTAANLPARSGGDNLAYVIYTSGSTGVPKGAMVEHRGMLNHLYAKISELQLTDRDRIAQTASQCFDISVWQSLAALLVGGTVHIFADEIAHDGSRLLEETGRSSVSILETVPSLLRASLDEAARGSALPALSFLKCMIVTGETLPPELCRQWLSFYPGIPLLNAYGPTECSDDVTHHRLVHPPSEDVVHIPIGCPVMNIRMYVLDSRLQPVPIGVSGGLYVGGVGVGRGYLNDAARTAEVFIPDPLSGEPGVRLYRTGDLGRYLPDGGIEFLGREDQQVKVRGFRIELGEIEAALCELPDVREAVALLSEDHPGGPRLVAYVVPAARGPGARGPGEWRAELKRRLPEYMLPAAMVALDELPLTPNGKVDRRALPAPDGPRPGLDGKHVAPRTASEKMLVEVWEQVLGVKQIGVHDNFFELGGDSILMIQIISRARRAGVQLTLKQVFQHQTVAELAALAPATRIVDAEQEIVIGPVPLTPAQSWLLEQNLLDLHHFNQSLMLEAHQPILPWLVEKAVGHLLAHHDALRLRLKRQDTGWQQFNAPVEGEGTFSYVDLSSLPEQTQRDVIQAAAEDLQSSLNLFEGPLMRVALFERGARQLQRLLIVIHHLAIDGVSWRILLEDLQTACQQLGQGVPGDLPVKTTSFKQWAEKLSEHARSAELRQELDYWLAEPRTRDRRLPLDTVGAINTVRTVRSLSASLTKDETQSLLQVIPTAYHAQINEVLLAALAQTFARWTGRRRTLIDLESHGREDIFDSLDLSRTVGWFTAIYPVLLDLGRASEPKEILRLIKDQVRKVPNHGIGYGLLRYMSADTEVREALDQLPPSEVIFNYLGQFDNTPSGSSSWGWAPESSGPPRSMQQNRRYLFEISGSVVGGQLHLTWKYGEGLHKHSTIQRLVWGFLDALRALIASAAETGGQPSPDSYVVELSQGKIDKALAELELGE